MHIIEDVRFNGINQLPHCKANFVQVWKVRQVAPSWPPLYGAFTWSSSVLLGGSYTVCAWYGEAYCVCVLSVASRWPVGWFYAPWCDHLIPGGCVSVNVSWRIRQCQNDDVTRPAGNSGQPENVTIDWKPVSRHTHDIIFYFVITEWLIIISLQQV